MINKKLDKNSLVALLEKFEVCYFDQNYVPSLIYIKLSDDDNIPIQL